MDNLILMGFMGAGKTTVGRGLSKELHRELIDTDEWIEQEQGRRISDIFAQDGEAAFRDMETALLERLQHRTEPFVLSIGGGMPLREENRALLRTLGTVIYLRASKEELLRRLSGDRKRPLLQGGSLEEKITSLMNARERIYLETAHTEIVTDGKNVQEIVKSLANYGFYGKIE